ncbi:MAG: helix-turn-helix transcriptional regulator [Alphaproteobacteria bacterium]|nr:helix-turn-helix transcriptional regulator [Alphaproteobacteria bacterium]
MYNRLQNIGSNVKKLRKKKKLSQIELAVEVGIDRSYLSEIENGRTNMSVSVLYAIADSLGVDIAELFKKNE